MKKRIITRSASHLRRSTSEKPQNEAQQIVAAAIGATIGKRGQPSGYRLAQRIGATPQQVSDWLHGRKAPNAVRLLELIRVAREKVEMVAPPPTSAGRDTSNSTPDAKRLTRR